VRRLREEYEGLRKVHEENNVGDVRYHLELSVEYPDE